MLVWYLGSLALTVAANLAYHICMKATHVSLNPMVSLMATYLTAAACTAMMLPLSTPKPIGPQFALIRWPTLVLGFSICFLELGFLLAYRSGWKLNAAALASNVLVGVLLVPIGFLFFRERVTMTNLLGVLLAIVGLFLIGRREA
jgi:drug/metabolite transporter (DMT)-like permease